MKFWLKPLSLLVCVPLLYACSSNNAVKKPQLVVKDTHGLDLLTGQFSKNIDQIWGIEELLIASGKDYVKYTNGYYTRSHIGFEEGLITVETQLGQDHLQRAIIHTLLMGSNPKGIDLFDVGETPISDQPFLTGQVADQFGRNITTFSQASDFADYLIRHHLQQRQLKNGRVVYLVHVRMIANHVNVRARKYLSLVRKASRQYNIDESLILAIMQTESSFNPYAISYANAMGLMQIVPRTAGRDVFDKVKNRAGQPSKKYLFDPANNIDMGVAYLWLLKQEYLQGIENPLSLRYAMISSYNSGAGAVLRVFSSQPKEAIEIINSLSPEQVYRILTTKHPSEQARNYLLKVHKAHKQYRAG